MSKIIMDHISWFLVFVFRVICTFPIVFIIGLPVVFITNIVVFNSLMHVYSMLIAAFIISLVVSIRMVLKTDF